MIRDSSQLCALDIRQKIFKSPGIISQGCIAFYEILSLIFYRSYCKHRNYLPTTYPKYITNKLHLGQLISCIQNALGPTLLIPSGLDTKLMFLFQVEYIYCYTFMVILLEILTSTQPHLIPRSEAGELERWEDRDKPIIQTDHARKGDPFCMLPDSTPIFMSATSKSLKGSFINTTLDGHVCMSEDRIKNLAEVIDSGYPRRKYEYRLELPSLERGQSCQLNQDNSVTPKRKSAVAASAEGRIPWTVFPVFVWDQPGQNYKPVIQDCCFENPGFCEDETGSRAVGHPPIRRSCSTDLYQRRALLEGSTGPTAAHWHNHSWPKMSMSGDEEIRNRRLVTPHPMTFRDTECQPDKNKQSIGLAQSSLMVADKSQRITRSIGVPLYTHNRNTPYLWTDRATNQLSGQNIHCLVPHSSQTDSADSGISVQGKAERLGSVVHGNQLPHEFYYRKVHQATPATGSTEAIMKHLPNTNGSHDNCQVPTMSSRWHRRKNRAMSNKYRLPSAEVESVKSIDVHFNQPTDNQRVQDRGSISDQQQCALDLVTKGRGRRKTTSGSHRPASYLSPSRKGAPTHHQRLAIKRIGGTMSDSELHPHDHMGRNWELRSSPPQSNLACRGSSGVRRPRVDCKTGNQGFETQHAASSEVVDGSPSRCDAADHNIMDMGCTGHLTINFVTSNASDQPDTILSTVTHTTNNLQRYSCQPIDIRPHLIGRATYV